MGTPTVTPPRVLIKWDAVPSSEADEFVVLDLSKLTRSEINDLQHACLVALGEADPPEPTPVLTLRPGLFDIDWSDGAGQFSGPGMPGLPGFTTGDKWNGWATPLFTKEVAQKIAAAPIWKDKPGSYDPERDSFLTPYENGPGEFEEWRGQDHTVNGQTVRLYPIGAFCWTWDEIKADK